MSLSTCERTNSKMAKEKLLEIGDKWSRVVFTGSMVIPISNSLQKPITINTNDELLLSSDSVLHKKYPIPLFF